MREAERGTEEGRGGEEGRRASGERKGRRGTSEGRTKVGEGGGGVAVKISFMTDRARRHSVGNNPRGGFRGNRVEKWGARWGEGGVELGEKKGAGAQLSWERTKRGRSTERRKGRGTWEGDSGGRTEREGVEGGRGSGATGNRGKR